jgi:heptosyltransferase-1
MRVAIVKLSAMGDIVHAMVALQFIKKYRPDIEIDWIVEDSLSGVLAHNPDISNIRTVNLKALKKNKCSLVKEIQKVRRFAEKKYDLIIDAQGLLKSAVTARFLGHKVAGFGYASVREKAAALCYDIKVNFPYHENTIERNIKILSEPLGFQVNHNEIATKKVFLFFDPQALTFNQDEFFQKNIKTVVMVIGSTWPSRNYPPEKFVAIAKALSTDCLVIWGNQEEKQLAEEMVKQCATIKLMPKLDLNSLKAVIAKSDLVIGNDTGPTHMAWGLNRPSITIFGPTPVNRVFQTDINKVIKSDSKVNPYRLNKQDFSIKTIDEKSIIDMAKALLLD